MYRRNLVYSTLFIAVIAVAAAYADEAEQPTLKSVSNKLVCQCDCNMILYVCNHVNCPSAIPMRKVITQKLDAGVPEEQIIADFVAQYGQQVLSAPPARGFNLNAYIIPFILLFIGLLIIVLTLRRWRRNVEANHLDHEMQPHIPSKADRIEKELEAFD